MEAQGAEIITSCHFFEHLTDEEAKKLLQECYQALRPGGIFRIAVPDFAELVRHYLDNDWGYWDLLAWNSFSDPATRTIIDVCSYGVYQFGEHKSIWDKAKLQAYLEWAGFREVSEVGYDTTYEPDAEVRRRYTICFQGLKKS